MYSTALTTEKTILKAKDTEFLLEPASVNLPKQHFSNIRNLLHSINNNSTHYQRTKP